MQDISDHKERINKELIGLGVTRYGRMKFAYKYLPSVIQTGEHIRGIVYGRHKSGDGFLAFTEGMLIATDQRIIFLDHKPGYTNMDELTYDVVSGVRLTTAGWTAVTLHTRLGDYTIRYANTKTARTFVSYIESRRIKGRNHGQVKEVDDVRSDKKTAEKFDTKALDFLEQHDLAVLSTIDRGGNVNGATVHYLIKDNMIYILTKSETQKAHNTFAHHQVSVTVYDSEKMQTVQIQGEAEVESTQEIKDYVFSNLTKARKYGTENRQLCRVQSPLIWYRQSKPNELN